MVVLQTVAGAGHVNNLAAVDEAVEDGRGNGSVAEEIGPLVKALVGSNNEGSSLAHGGDEAKEKIGLGRRERHEADLVHNHKGSFVKILLLSLKLGNNTFDLSRFARRRKRRQPQNIAHITSDSSVRK